MLPLIQKATETMTAKERVRRTFAFEKTDRVTIGYDTNPAVHHRLCRALGMENDDMLRRLRSFFFSSAVIGYPSFSSFSVTDPVGSPCIGDVM